jgi:hypothetical protein
MRPFIVVGLLGLWAATLSDAVPSQSITELFRALSNDIHAQNASYTSQPLFSRAPVTDPADDNLWDKCVCKGTNLLEAITMPDRDAAQRL